MSASYDAPIELDIPHEGIDLNGDTTASLDAPVAKKRSAKPLVIATILAVTGAVGYGMYSGTFNKLMPGAANTAPPPSLATMPGTVAMEPQVPAAVPAPAVATASVPAEMGGALVPIQPAQVQRPVPAAVLAPEPKPIRKVEVAVPDSQDVKVLSARIAELEAKLKMVTLHKAAVKTVAAPVPASAKPDASASVIAKTKAKPVVAAAPSKDRPQAVTVIGITQDELVIKRGGTEKTMRPGDQFTNGERIVRIDDKAMTVETDHGVYKVKL